MVFVLMISLVLIAMLYASVGHGGASGYLAVLALSGAPADQVRATALSLNIAVSAIAYVHFARSTRFRADLLFRFAVAAVPSALLAGAFGSLDQRAFNLAVSLVLVFAAFRMAMPTTKSEARVGQSAPALRTTLPIGAAIGLLSGLIGVGGGIFLSPVLLIMRWATPKETAAVSAAFILVSSIAGLIGLTIQFGRPPVLVSEILFFAPAVLVGGWIGAHLGATRLNGIMFRRILAFVLLGAALKLGATAIA
jgi:uncharacterized membrane protein YfcA